MLTIITLIGCAILFIVLTVVFAYLDRKSCNDYDCVAMTFGIIGFCALVAAIVTTITLINRQARFDYCKEQYYNVKSIVDEYNGGADTLSAARLQSFEGDIRLTVIETNNMVSEHRVMSKSPWVNLWYSEEVGNLPRLELNERRDG